jgi:nucleoside-diphosphate-sugar epimerase
MLSETNSGFFNVGTGVPIKIRDLAKIMIKICKKEFEPIFQSALEGDVKRSQSDIELTKKMINWESEVGLEVGLEEFVKNYS